MGSAASCLGGALALVTHAALHIDASACAGTVALVDAGCLDALLVQGGLFGIMGGGRVFIRGVFWRAVLG